MTVDEIANFASVIISDGIKNEFFDKSVKISSEELLVDPIKYIDSDIKVLSDAAKAIIDNTDLFIDGVLVDDRDGKQYKTIRFAGLEIMAENLAYVNDFNSIVKNNNVFYTTDNTELIAPNGWHILSSYDENVIIDYFGGRKIAGKFLKHNLSTKLNIMATGWLKTYAIHMLPTTTTSFWVLDYGKYNFMSTRNPSIGHAMKLSSVSNFVEYLDMSSIVASCVRCVKDYEI